MEFEQIYLGCLAQASYLVGDGGECAVVDPRRDVDVYLDEARARGLTIRHVLLTHVHADFVSGHCELAERTGATIVVSHRAKAGFPHRAVRDGDEVVVGGVTIRVLETPGHTPESVTFLVDDGDPATPLRALTGDTLFVGGAGRPDLVGSKGFTPEEMAAMHYASLRDKLLTLPDDTLIFPGHGPGSACGKGISEEKDSTLGREKATNPALRASSEEEFVRFAVTGLCAPPPYFAHDAAYNRRGAPALGALAEVPGLDAAAFAARVAAGALVLDVRDAAAFAAGHVRGARNVGLDGNFATWCGNLVPADAELLLVADSDADAATARVRLARVGIEGVVGFLAGGMEAWGEPATLATLDVHALAAAPSLAILDVRGPGEREDGYVPRSRSIPLPELPGRLGELDLAAPLAVVCKTGYRSSAACSLLAAAGAVDVRNVVGGTDGWVEAGLALEHDQPVEA